MALEPSYLLPQAGQVLTRLCEGVRRTLCLGYPHLSALQMTQVNEEESGDCDHSVHLGQVWLYPICWYHLHLDTLQCNAESICNEFLFLD